LVLVSLAGLAYWGHTTGWKIPRFSSLTGNAGEEKNDWCEAHSIPESQCVECNAKLLPKPPAYGWCEEHGVHDCPWHHPDVAQLADAPVITKADLERARQALNFADRPKNNQSCKLHPRRIQFASIEAVDKAGIHFPPVGRSLVEEVVSSNGEVSYDPTRVAHLAAPVAGRLWRSLAEVGKVVKQGDILALVDAAEVGKAKAEFQHALAQLALRRDNLDQLAPAYRRGAIAEARYREAVTARREAEIRLAAVQQALANLGLPVRTEEMQGLAAGQPDKLGERLRFLGVETLADGLKAEGTATANLIPVKAPRDGVVVVRHGTAGEQVDPSRTLFVVADPGRLWLTLHVRPDVLKPFRQKDPALLLRGKTVRFGSDGTREEVTGTITWVSTAVDPKTRTLQVRADLSNPGGRLQANTFGSGQIVLRQEKRAVVVPSEAVHWDGNCHIVFVWDKTSHRPDAPKVFHVRTVQPGVKFREKTEIIAGLLPGEMVATQGSGVLRAELLKANLGEG
jgi:cobalt-zinc-cadmium efflux system membrane fusion protein